MILSKRTLNAANYIPAFPTERYDNLQSFTASRVQWFKSSWVQRYKRGEVQVFRDSFAKLHNLIDFHPLHSSPTPKFYDRPVHIPKMPIFADWGTTFSPLRPANMHSNMKSSGLTPFNQSKETIPCFLSILFSTQITPLLQTFPICGNSQKFLSNFI